MKIGKQEGWLNEVAAALAELGLTEVKRNTGSHIAGIPIEADIVMEEPGFRVFVTLFSDSELARQAELGQSAKSDVRTARSTGHSAAQQIDRVHLVAVGAKRKKVNVDRLDAVADAVEAIDLPASPRDAAVVREDGPAASATADEIERLAKLHEGGALTDEEFAEAKRKVLRT